jgi:type I restriction enzyme S subunit
MSVWELPEGWETLPLGEACEINPKRPRLSRDEDELTSFVPMAAVDEKRGVIAEAQVRPYAEVKRGYTYFEESDVLFAKITPSMQNGKSAVAQHLIDGIGFGSTEFHVLRPSEQVLPEWVHLFVRQWSFREEAIQHFRGAVGQQRVPSEFLENHPFPVAPVHEQLRLVARIEEMFARIEEAQRLRVAADEDAERLISAALEEIFGEAKNKEWPIKTVDDLIMGKPQYGTSQKASEEPVGTPMLRMGNIVDGKISFDGLKYIDLPPDEQAKYLLNEGDILFNRTNSAELVGKSAVYPGGRQAVFASYLIRIVAHPDRALPHFVVAYINSPLGRQYIESQLTRAIGQVNVNAQKLKAMPLPVPPLSEQRRIVEHLDAVQAQIAELKRIQAESTAELERLEGAILARAFRGEL